LNPSWRALTATAGASDSGYRSTLCRRIAPQHLFRYMQACFRHGFLL
jgi:hypothetical protein